MLRGIVTELTVEWEQSWQKKKYDQVLLFINPSQPGHVRVQVHVKHWTKTVLEGKQQQCMYVCLLQGN